jgi:hypothetical protein
MATRLMAKTFDVKLERDDAGKIKGSPLQSKINQFTKGKNIPTVHSFEAVAVGTDEVKAVLIYDSAEGEGPRVLSKVIDAPLGSELQTKVNAFTKDKDLDVRAVSIAPTGDNATVAVLYTRNDAASSDDE